MDGLLGNSEVPATLYSSSTVGSNALPQNAVVCAPCCWKAVSEHVEVIAPQLKGVIRGSIHLWIADLHISYDLLSRLQCGMRGEA
jgi:hypothetical protein